ncbi:MAG: hypothetical protein ACREBS_02050 [Nitrososphaerales archaeon]
MDFIKALRHTIEGKQEDLPIEKRTPIHILNVREEGYLTFCYGANTVTSPFARPPFVHISHNNRAQDPRDAGKGSFYHPIDMRDDSVAVCMEKSMRMDYRIACSFNPCRTFARFHNPALAYEYAYNEWRKEHFFHTKNDESKQIKETPIPLNMALRDKFARSWQAFWLPFLDETPTLPFRIGAPEN